MVDGGSVLCPMAQRCLAGGDGKRLGEAGTQSLTGWDSDSVGSQTFGYGRSFAAVQGTVTCGIYERI